MKRFWRIIAVVLCAVTVLSAVSCGNDSAGEYAVYNYFAMDTYITLKFGREKSSGGVLEEGYLDEVAGRCEEIIRSVDGAISCHSKKSAAYALNLEIHEAEVENDILLSTMTTAEALADLTGGAYDFTLGRLTELWNVTGDRTEPPEQYEIDQALSHSGRDKYKLSGSRLTKSDIALKFDFGGIGKGIAAQDLLEYLDTTEVEYGMVSLGGNVGVFGKKPGGDEYKIGLRDPIDTDGIMGYVYVGSGFVSVSGDYERFFDYGGVRYHHILDPGTGKPADSSLHSVAVISSNGAAADALSTALFVMGKDKALDLYNAGKISFEAVFVTADGEVITTPGLSEDDFELKK